jgi:hypothetical protein
MSSGLSQSDWIALISGVSSFTVGAAALIVAIYAIRRGNKNTSAATLVALNVAFRDSWEKFLQAKEDDLDIKAFHFAELMNLFELACAVYREKSLAGNSRDLVRKYMEEILGKLVKSPYADARIPDLLTGETTFIHIKEFLNHRPAYLSVTVPKKWYQDYAR